MRALDRKLLRDLLQMKGQVTAICLVIACGVATFVMTLSTLQSLDRTLREHYDRYHFADVFARLKRAPAPAGERIGRIPGVALVQTRVVADVTLDVEGLDEPAAGRLISIPETATPGLNDLHLRAGRYIRAGTAGEVLAGEAFAAAHGLRPGDHVSAVIQGKWRRLDIVGIVLSPEYVYQLREGEWLPDDRRFGVFWMGGRELAAAFDMEGAFNDVSLTLAPGADERQVLDRLDRVLKPYGGVGSVGRSEQQSHRYITDELTALRGSGLILPVIFLAVAAFLLNVVLSRLVGTQREQIAALKAFGYTGGQIALHYLKLVFLVVLAGVALGTLSGTWLGRMMAGEYRRLYRFPALSFHVDPLVVAAALLVSGASGVAGVVGAVRRAVALPPAEAMRPEAPPTYRPTLVERAGLHRFLSASARMVLRHLERRPLRAVLTSLGIALAVGTLVLGFFNKDLVDYVTDYQFHGVQRQDMGVAFVEPTAAGVAHDLAALPGVLRCEPYRAMAVKLWNGHRSRRVGIMGLSPDRDRVLSRLLDERGRSVPLPPDGLLLSAKLAELLGVAPGQPLTVEVLEGTRSVREVPVNGTITEFTGTNAYMDLRALNRLLREGDVLSGAMLSVDSRGAGELYATLKVTPRVASVTIKEAALRGFLATFARNILIMRTFTVAFATILCFGVVYNSAQVSLAERARELASLRVLGFTRGEISAILLGELGVLTLAAIPLGLAAGYGFAAVVVRAIDTETHRFPLVIEPSTYAVAVVITLAAAVLSGLVVRRRLDRLDLVAVLKSRE